MSNAPQCADPRGPDRQYAGSRSRKRRLSNLTPADDNDRRDHGDKFRRKSRGIAKHPISNQTLARLVDDAASTILLRATQDLASKRCLCTARRGNGHSNSPVGQLGSFRIAQSQPKRTICPGRLLIEQGGISALHFFRRDRFKMAAEQPLVTERITHLAGALAVELIL